MSDLPETPRRSERHRRTRARRPRPTGWRRWLRWAANLMIVGGVLLLAYPVGTWGYTWYEQRQMRQELTRDHPGLATAQAALDSRDLVPATPPATTAGAGGTQSAPDPAETERLAQLAAFKAAADAFVAKMGSTGTPIGRIVVPAIGLDVVMLEGTGNGDLREGPGHWPETPFPGQGGNFVVSGHRTTYGHPFFKLDKIRIGDEIDLVLPYGVAKYLVTRSIIVEPDEVQTVAQAGKEQVSLAACHPIYSASHRIVVQGDLVAFRVVQQ